MVTIIVFSHSIISIPTEYALKCQQCQHLRMMSCENYELISRIQAKVKIKVEGEWKLYKTDVDSKVSTKLWKLEVFKHIFLSSHPYKNVLVELTV